MNEKQSEERKKDWNPINGNEMIQGESNTYTCIVYRIYILVWQ